MVLTTFWMKIFATDCNENQNNDSDSLSDKLLPGKLLFTLLDQTEFLTALSDRRRIVPDHGKGIFPIQRDDDKSK